MKKIATVIAIIAAFAVIGFVCWRYFDNNFKEYNSVAELEIDKDDEIYFFKESFVKISEEQIKAYYMEGDGRLTEIYSRACSSPSVVFSSEDYVVILNNGEYCAYSANGDAFTQAPKLEGEFICARQFSDRLYVKMKDINDSGVVIYAYDETGLENLSLTKDFKFIDYCYDDSSENEFFISYEASGEYIKLIIRIYNNERQIKRIELDNVVYNDFDYISGMFAFYTEHSMLFINTDTLVRREQRCYDIEALEKFIYDDKIAYYWEEAFFDGVNNMFIVNKESWGFVSFGNRQNVCAYNKNLIYTDEKHVKFYDFGGSLLEDNVLFSEEGILRLGVMNDVIAAIKSDKIIFMRRAD